MKAIFAWTLGDVVAAAAAVLLVVGAALLRLYIWNLDRKWKKEKAEEDKRWQDRQRKMKEE